MKPVPLALSLGPLALLSALSPAVAFACPGACGSCSTSGASGYVATLALGLMVGLGTVAAEDWLRKRR